MGKPVDLHAETVEVHDRNLAAASLEAGKHTLTFRNVGKSDESTGYFLGLDGILASFEK